MSDIAERIRSLVAIMRDESRPAGIRIRAADDLLDMCDPDLVRDLAQPYLAEAKAIRNGLSRQT